MLSARQPELARGTSALRIDAYAAGCQDQPEGRVAAAVEVGALDKAHPASSTSTWGPMNREEGSERRRWRT